MKKETVYTYPKTLALKLWDADVNPCGKNFYPLVKEIQQEAERLSKYVHEHIKNSEKRLEYLITYVNEPGKAKAADKHNINVFLPDFINTFFHNTTDYNKLKIQDEIKEAGGSFQYCQKIKSQIYCDTPRTMLNTNDYYYFTHAMLIFLVADIYDQIKEFEAGKKPQRKYPISFTKESREILEKAKEAGRVRYISIEEIEEGESFFDINSIREARVIFIEIGLDQGHIENNTRTNFKRIQEWFAISGNKISDREREEARKDRISPEQLRQLIP